MSIDTLNPAALTTVTIGGEDKAAQRAVSVKALTLKQLPVFARTLQPILDDVQQIISVGVSAKSLIALVETRMDDVTAALEAATGAPRAEIADSTIEQALDLLMAVLQANRNFFKGRAASALRMAALIGGTGPTPSKPSSGPAGPSRKSSASTSTS